MIPAWKRLGLKLKFAKDEPDDPDESESPRNGHLNGDDSEVQQPAKRRRIENSAIKLNAHEIRNPAESPIQPRRKKSVSFTEDTKTEDGDSRVTIDFPVDLAESILWNAAHRPEFTQNTTEQKSLDATEASSNQSMRGSKEKSKSVQEAASKFSVRKSKDSLDYLNQHHIERATWKYNKNRDVWVMKHALSTETIPTTYNRALAGYVHGLPPKAGARLRLVEQCRETLPEITPPATNDHYENLFRNDLNNAITDEQDPGYGQWLSQMPRPLLLMLALGVDNRASANGQAAGANIKSLPPFVKKKKARTRAEIEVSSSSESDSDSSSESSDSSSDSDLAHETKTSGNLGDHAGLDSTSSSGSSTDSSDFD